MIKLWLFELTHDNHAINHDEIFESIDSTKLKWLKLNVGLRSEIVWPI